MSQEDIKINEKGEMVRDRESLEKREVEPAQQLNDLFIEMQGGNNMPPGMTGESGRVYYKQDQEHFRMDHVRSKLEEFKKIAEESGINQFLDQSGSYITVNESVGRIEANLAYSEKINTEIAENPDKYKLISSEERRKKMREKLLGESKETND